MEQNIKHGFIITTATFSDRAKNSVEKFKAHNQFQIELIDQNRMADIMLCSHEGGHGLGLYKSDADQVIQMNKRLLFDSVRNAT